MVEGARERGYEYLAITDHSATPRLRQPRRSPTRCARRSSASARSTPSSTTSTLLIGTETNVLTDGSLDYDDELLAELDWVVASVHTSFAMSEADMTARMVAAIEHPLVDVIGHPTGRKIETRAAVPGRHGAGDRGGGAHAHDARDQRRARPARPQRDPRARGRRGRRADRGRLRRALRPQPRADALRHRDGAARVAHAGAGGEHAPVGGAGSRCASGAAPPHEPRFRAGVRAGVPFAVAGGLLAASFGVLATRRRDAGLGGRADVGDRLRRLGADRRAHDPRRGRRARLGARRRGADELPLPADGGRVRPVAARRAGARAPPQGQTVVDASLGDRGGRQGRLRPQLLFGSSAIQYATWVQRHRGRRARRRRRSAIPRRSASTRSTRRSSSRC